MACCCGTWLRFMVSLVHLSLFLLVAVVVSRVIFLLTRSPVQGLDCARHLFAGHATRRARVLLGLAVYYSPAYMSQDEATRKFVRRVIEFYSYFLGLSA